MSRTVRNDKHKRWYAKESTASRRAENKARRAKDTERVRLGRDPERHRGTQGWLTH